MQRIVIHQKKGRKKAVVAVLLFMWIIWSNITVGITHYTVSSDRIPSAFEQYKIAVVSDVHNARFGKDNRYLISVIEKERPDIIAITGDLVDSSKTDIEAANRLVQELVRIAPCYYVTGNHEAWIGSRYRELEKKLLDAGVVIFHGNFVNLGNNNETIQLAGLDDSDFRNGDLNVQGKMPEAALEEMELTEDYCILLAHRPENFSTYVSADIDLVLSGHAHGGQVRLPFIGGVAAPGQGLFPKYDAGEYSENNTTMIVSRGIGNSVVPVRINNRPEVVIVTLQTE